MDKTQAIKRFIADIVVLGLGGVVLLLFRLIGKPYERGFFCSDETLQHPYKDSTVPSYILYLVGFFAGAIMMLAIETMRTFYGPSEPIRDKEGNAVLSQWQCVARDFYLAFVPFCFGAVLEHTISAIGKYGVGRLRPHFFSVCNIDVTKLNCSAGYIEDFTCINDDDNKIREVRLSFPSGHSSFASYIAIYLIIYLQVRLTLVGNSLLRPFFQTVIFSLAWFTCLSRISDYKHHPTDVLGGAVVGIVAAVAVACCASDLFTSRKQKPPPSIRPDMSSNFTTSM